MAQVSLTGSASRQQSEILRALGEAAGPAVAEAYMEKFRNLYAALQLHPETGSPRPKLGARIRIRIVDPYNVYYSYDRHTCSVLVLCVIHGRRKISRRMMRP